jgi:L-cysteine desulfidase
MKRKFIINLLKQLVIPAFGCTEIGSIAYAAGTASKYLKHKLKDMTVYVSGFIYRNVANVGVPKMGKVGVEGIAAGGFLVKQPQKKLLILNAITDKQIKESEEMVKKHLIKTIILKTCDPVYVRVVVKDVKNNVCDVLVERKHDVIRHIKLNNRIMDGNTDLGESKNVSDVKFNVNDISLNDIYEIVRSLEMKDLKFLEKGITMNENIAKAGNQKNYFVIKVKND